ncbi:TIGR01777 family oxidoreductase [Actinocrispum wychmicini]|uniref:TIGR01777 family protein n=1 Tax=Actinocrispum wychmicini TaxID=1213861 RepID=A0A4R2IS31_9PSEU|nr:TIGR01777 family oxidoreductase [Actinocrispum wychmicini]TCO48034.1 hypothetical protein EV192_11687 [Actinocrispum wychmicini]
MRVVVAGSSGLIGTELVATLRRDRHEVVRLVRRPATAADERTWDPPAARIEDGALDGVDAVVNLCGPAITLNRLSGARKQAIVDGRIEPTEVLAAAVAEHRIPLLVNANAVGYYGDHGAAEIDEATPAGTGFLSTMCTEWEAATTAATEAGARVVTLRTGLVLSPRGGLLGPLRTLFSVMLGGRLGDGRQYMPWIHHEDEIAAIMFTLTNTVTGPVNLTAPNPVTNAEFTRVLARVLGRPAPWVVPKFALRAVLGTELVDDAALASQRVVPKVLQDNGFKFEYSLVEPALRSVL